MVTQATADAPTPDASGPDAADADIRYLRALEQKVLWLSVWMIHHANHRRPSRDGLKVGGHQASCASVTTLMTALYFDALRPPIGSPSSRTPVRCSMRFSTCSDNQTQDQLERDSVVFGGAQSYPSRTKDRRRCRFLDWLGRSRRRDDRRSPSLVQDYHPVEGVRSSRRTSRPGG